MFPELLKEIEKKRHELYSGLLYPDLASRHSVKYNVALREKSWEQIVGTDQEKEV